MKRGIAVSNTPFFEILSHTGYFVSYIVIKKIFQEIIQNG